MNKIIIKRVNHSGCSTAIFRAYKDYGGLPSPKTTLKVTSSCTNNPEVGAIRCAAKAFAKYVEPGGDVDEIETRVKVVADKDHDNLWQAELQPKCPCDTLSDTRPVKSWFSVEISMPDADRTVMVYSPRANEPVWLGYWDGECWREVSADAYDTEVTHWMDLPNPPEVVS